MNTHDRMFQVFVDIDTANEISHATLNEVMENIDDDRYRYIILGILEQLEKIKDALNRFDEVMRIREENGCVADKISPEK